MKVYLSPFFSYSHTDFYFWFVLMFILTMCVKIFFCCFLIIAVITWIFSTFMTFPFILLKSLYCIELFITYVTLMFLIIRIWYFMLIEGLFYLKHFITLITVISYWLFMLSIGSLTLHDLTLRIFLALWLMVLCNCTCDI